MIKELEDIQRNMKMPGCSVVTVGDTGAGKSTLLNALLGETNVLPTNGMRACTAAIIEMQYNKEEEGKPYLGEVEFVSKEDWDDEFTQVRLPLPCEFITNHAHEIRRRTMGDLSLSRVLASLWRMPRSDDARTE
jgi:energy-coupling factor transporter ATP-binding protein EcfA2